MQHVLHPVDRTASHIRLRQIAFEEFDTREVIEIPAFTCNQAVDDSDAMTATDKFFRKMRPDEPGAAGDEI